MKGFEAREIIDDDGNFCGYCDECSGSDPCLRCDRNELRDEARRLRESVYSQINRRRDEHSKMHEAVAETKQARAERDEALSLLRELSDWADLAYRDVARPDDAEVIADALAFVDRASEGDQA